jgi:hypothetical protein
MRFSDIRLIDKNHPDKTKIYEQREQEITERLRLLKNVKKPLYLQNSYLTDTYGTFLAVSHE